MQTGSVKTEMEDRLPEKKFISGNTRIISAINLSLTQRLLNEDQSRHLIVYADIIRLNSNLSFPAKNLSMYARIIVLEKDCKISTHVDDEALKQSSFTWSSPKMQTVPDFFEAAFTEEEKNAASLRDKITKMAGNVVADIKNIKDNVEWLNQTLQLTGLYKAAEKSPEIQTPGLKQLATETASIRSKPYSSLSSDEQKKIQKLNRKIIDTIYPKDTTKQLTIWLDYQSTDSALEGEGFQAASLNTSNGGNGKPGYDGRNGSDGLDGGDIDILAGQIEFNNFTLSLDTSGGRGGRGQKGGTGGYGGKAGVTTNKIELIPNYWLTDLRINGKTTHGVNGGLGTRIAPHGIQLIKDAMNKAGTGGNGGKAGKSGNGGAGGHVIVRCISSFEENRIKSTTTGGPAGPAAEGGNGGRGGDAPEIDMIVWNINQQKTEKFTGDPGPVGAKGKSNLAASAGRDAESALSKTGYDAFLLGFGDSTGLSDQRTMTYRAMKACYLKGEQFMDYANALINWLSDTNPDPLTIDKKINTATLPPSQQKEIAVMTALRSNVKVLKGYLAAGVDFYGHSWNFTPVFSFEHYNSRINDMLRTGKLIEEERLLWKNEKRARKNITEELNKTITRINTGINKTDNGFTQLLEDRQEAERQLNAYRLRMDNESSAIFKKQRAFMEAVDSKLKLAFGIGCLNLLAQVVLISTGNAAYGKYLKYAGTAIDKIRDRTGMDQSFTDPIKESFESASKAMESLDKYNKDKKEITAKIIDDGDKQRIKVEINKQAEKPKEGGFKGLYSTGVDVVQNVLPIIGTATELWEIGKKMGEVQEKFGFDSLKIAMDNGSYESMIDQFAQYANTEAKEFKAIISSFMELVKNRNELLLNYRALQGKCAELYAKNALLSTQLALCRERMAQAEDPTSENMDQFWSTIYECMRDRILDRIYDEYKTYRFYSVTNQPFSEISINNILRGQSEPGSYQDTIDDIELNPDITALSLLQDAVAEKMFAAEEKQFGSWKAFRNNAGRVKFEQEHYKEAFLDLKNTGKASFYISPEQPVFKKLAYVSIDSVEAFFIRKTDNTDATAVQVSLLLHHEGFVSVKNKAGQLLTYAHNKPNAFSYEYGSFFDADGGTRPRYKKDDERLSDNTDNQVFYEISGNQTTITNKYIRINPCTWWTVEIDQENTTGLNLEDVTELVFQFNGKGVVINS